VLAGEKKMKKILKLTLKKQWFDMILSGKKKEEYRECKPYWFNRLRGRYANEFKKFDFVLFRNGYNQASPVIVVEFLEIVTGIGKSEWGAPKEDVIIIKLGKIIKTENVKTAVHGGELGNRHTTAPA
jgi:hypothetical protein